MEAKGRALGFVLALALLTACGGEGSGSGGGGKGGGGNNGGGNGGNGRGSHGGRNRRPRPSPTISPFASPTTSPSTSPESSPSKMPTTTFIPPRNWLDRLEKSPPLYASTEGTVEQATRGIGAEKLQLVLAPEAPALPRPLGIVPSTAEHDAAVQKASREDLVLLPVMEGHQPRF